MATAKQIAWRKKFAAMSRAGVFANPGARSEVRSPTSTRTGTKTSTEADTQGNITVTGGAGRGATTSVTVRGMSKGKSTRKRAAPRKNPGSRNSTAANVALATNPINVFKVQANSRGTWTTIVRTAYEADAMRTARMLAAANPKTQYRVIDNT